MNALNATSLERLADAIIEPDDYEVGELEREDELPPHRLASAVAALALLLLMAMLFGGALSLRRQISALVLKRVPAGMSYGNDEHEAILEGEPDARDRPMPYADTPDAAGGYDTFCSDGAIAEWRAAVAANRAAVAANRERGARGGL